MAAVFGVGLTALVNVIPRVRPSFTKLGTFAGASAAVLVGVLAIESYAYRLDVVVPYYSFVDGQEFAAMDYLAGRSGTVVLTSKGVNLNKGTEYSWLIEGISRERAIGSGTFAINLSPADVAEARSAELFAAGPAVVDDGRLRAAFDGTQQSGVSVFGNVNGTWYHLFDVGPHDGALVPSTVSTSVGPFGGEITSSNNPGDAPASLRLGATDHMLHMTFPASQLGSDHKIEVSPATGLSCIQDPCTSEPSGPVTLLSSSIEWIAPFEGRSIRVTISSPPESGAEPLVTPSGVAFRSSVANQGLAIDVGVVGLTGSTRSVATFTQAQLIRDQNIQYLWTWKESQSVGRYAARACLALVYENDEVAIFHVDQNCRG
jgi:hypothetical protein